MRSAEAKRTSTINRARSLLLVVGVDPQSKSSRAARSQDSVAENAYDPPLSHHHIEETTEQETLSRRARLAGARLE